MSVQPLDVNLGPSKGRDSPFFQVYDILTLVKREKTNNMQ